MRHKFVKSCKFTKLIKIGKNWCLLKRDDRVVHFYYRGKIVRPVTYRAYTDWYSEGIICKICLCTALPLSQHPNWKFPVMVQIVIPIRKCHTNCHGRCQSVYHFLEVLLNNCCYDKWMESTDAPFFPSGNIGAFYRRLFNAR